MGKEFSVGLVFLAIPISLFSGIAAYVFGASLWAAFAIYAGTGVAMLLTVLLMSGVAEFARHFQDRHPNAFLSRFLTAKGGVS